jgi:hypothetical protein
VQAKCHTQEKNVSIPATRYARMDEKKREGMVGHAIWAAAQGLVASGRAYLLVAHSTMGRFA